MTSPAARSLFCGALLVLAALRVVVTAGAPAEARPFPYDDGLYVRTADALLRGEWLGPYDRRTLAKAPGYSFHLAAARVVGIPRRTADDLALATAALVFAWGLRRVGVGRIAVLCAAFAALTAPAHFSHSTAYTIREQFVSAQVLALFGLGFAALAAEGRAKRAAAAVAHGLLLAWFWYVREESVWILVPLAALFAALVVAERRRRGAWPKALAIALLFAAPSVVCVLGARAALRAANEAAYGAPITVEADDPDFADAVAAFGRIGEGAGLAKQPVPKAAREKLYAVSPTFASLRKTVESDAYRFGNAADANGDPYFAFWPFLLRDAFADAGEYRDLRATKAAYRRLADELNAACDAGVVPAGPRRSRVFPVITAALLPKARDRAFEQFKDLWTTRFASVVQGPEPGPRLEPADAALFGRTLPLPVEAPLDATTLARDEALAALHIFWSLVLPFLALAGAAALVVRLALAPRVPLDGRFAVVAVNATAIVVMTLLLALIRTYWWDTTTEYCYRVYALFPTACIVLCFDACSALFAALPADLRARATAPWIARPASALALCAIVAAVGATLRDAASRTRLYAVKGTPVFAYRNIDDPARPLRPLLWLEGRAHLADDRGEGFAVAFDAGDGAAFVRLQRAFDPAAPAPEFDVEVTVDAPPADLALRVAWRAKDLPPGEETGAVDVPITGPGPRRYRFAPKTTDVSELRFSFNRAPTTAIFRKLELAPR